MRLMTTRFVEACNAGQLFARGDGVAPELKHRFLGSASQDVIVSPLNTLMPITSTVKPSISAGTPRRRPRRHSRGVWRSSRHNSSRWIRPMRVCREPASAGRETEISMDLFIIRHSPSMSVLLFVMEAAARRVLDLIAVECLDARARGGVPESFHRRQIFRGRGSGEAWTQAHVSGRQSGENALPSSSAGGQSFLTAHPARQSEAGGNGSVEKSVDQSILPDDHHPARQLRDRRFHHTAARICSSASPCCTRPDQLQSVFQRVGRQTADSISRISACMARAE